MISLLRIRGCLHNKTLLDIAIFLLLGLLVFKWFKGDYIISCMDFFAPINRLPWLQKAFFVWDHSQSMGVRSGVDIAFVFPYYLYYGITELMGLSFVNAEKLLFYIWFTSSGISMYILTYVLKIPRIGRLAASIFYMMNPITLFTVWDFRQGLIQPIYSYIPLILALYIYGMETNKDTKYIILFSFVFPLTIGSSYANPAYAMLTWIVMAAYFLYFSAVKFPDFSAIYTGFRFSLRLCVAWTILNMYWILPMTDSVFDQISRMSNYLGSTNFQTFETNSMPILGIFRFLGYWALRGEYKGESFFPWADTYFSSMIVIILSFIPVIIGIAYVFNTRTLSSSIFFFLILYIFLIFLAKGVNSPLGGINTYLFKNIPFFEMLFRNLVTKVGFILPLSISPLIGAGLCVISNSISKRSLAISISFFVILLILSHPLWTGDNIVSGGNVLPSVRNEIPDYYWDARNYLDNRSGDFRVFPLPMSTYYLNAYNWKSGFFGGYLTEQLLNRSSISIISGNYDLPLSIGKATEGINQNINEFANVFGVLGAKYVIIHRDTRWNYIKGNIGFFQTNMPLLENFIKKTKDLKFEKTFGELDIYRIADLRLAPLIYSSSNLIIVPNEGGAYNFIKSQLFIPGECVTSTDNSQILYPGVRLINASTIDKSIVSSSNWFDRIPESLGSEKTLYCNKCYHPKIEYRRINPTKYIVSINTSSPFLLVFSEAYHPQWKVYIEERSSKLGEVGYSYDRLNVSELKPETKITPRDVFYSLDKSLPDYYHFRANNFANAWYLNKTGDYSVVIYFKPQSLLYVGSFISLTFFILFIIFLLVSYRPKRCLTK